MNYPLPHTHATALTGSGTSLLNDWREILIHLHEVEYRLRETRPHGRDYMNSREEHSAARDAHFAMERQVADLLDFTNTMIHHLNR